MAFNFFDDDTFICEIDNRNQPRFIPCDVKDHVSPDRIGCVESLLNIVIACPISIFNDCRPAPERCSPISVLPSSVI
jgi:hypothetical protein